MEIFEKILLGVIAVLLYLWIFSTHDNEIIVMKGIIKKIELYLDSIGFMIYSKDTKGLGPKYNPNPDHIKDQDLPSKRFIFIRHGESDWNNMFNKGVNLSMIRRLVNGFTDEGKVLFENKSFFIDSPLNEEGIEQALELSRFLESEHHPEASPIVKTIIDELRGRSGSSIVVTSTLRRAIATTTLALWPRIQRTHEKIMVLSSLQEISRNVDTRALSNAKQLADLPFDRISKKLEGFGNPDEIYDVNENHGNKSRSFYGIKRLRAFGEWAFQRSESTIIVGGHSLWFKHFFNTYLPHESDHPARTKKITNSGVVAFTVHRGQGPDGQALFRIDPNSIQVVYGGFTTK